MWQSGREPVSVARLPELAAGCMEQPECCVERSYVRSRRLKSTSAMIAGTAAQTRT